MFISFPVHEYRSIILALVNILGHHLNDKSTANACCRANTAKCQPCAAGLDIEDFCENKSTIIGCEGLKFNKI